MGIFQIVLVALVASVAAGPAKLASPYDIYKNTLIQPNKIVGGQDAERLQFPHQISLRWEGRHICGGTLIHPRWVLTAAHCKPYSYGQYSVVLGLLNQKEQHEDVQIINVREFIVHSNYPGGVAPYDIGLLELESEATITDAVQLASLPEDEQCNALGDAVLSGWGYTTSWFPTTPTTLKWATLPRMSLETCHSNLVQLTGDAGPLDETMLCTGSNPGQQQSACSGDSGGPLVVYSGDSATIIGVVSWGLVPCGNHELSPSIFTNVCSHRDFIKQHVV